MRIALFATWPNGQKVSVSNVQGRTIGHSHYCPILKRQVFRVTDANKKDVFTTIFGRSRSLNPSLPMFMMETDEVNEKDERILKEIKLDDELGAQPVVIAPPIQEPELPEEPEKEWKPTTGEDLIEEEDEGPKDVPQTLEEEIVTLVSFFPKISITTIARNLNIPAKKVADCIKGSSFLKATGTGDSAKISLS